MKNEVMENMQKALDALQVAATTAGLNDDLKTWAKLQEHMGAIESTLHNLMFHNHP